MTDDWKNDHARPYKVDENPHLSNNTDLPEWKAPTEGYNWEKRETEDPYMSTDFRTPQYLDKEDWW